MATGIWNDVWYRCFNHQVQNFFEMDIRRLRASTNVFEVLQKLGLTQATWLDFCLDNVHELNTWLCVYLHVRETHLAERFKAHPHARPGSKGRIEDPQAVPMEMLLYCITEDYYLPESGVPGAAKVSSQYILKDGEGSCYLVRIIDARREFFLVEASEKCSDLLYSRESPFFPILDVVPYASDPAIALVITPIPPVPFSAQLDYNCIYAGDELCRILERARDIYHILAALERRGISLDGLRPSDGWRKSLTYSTIGPWFLPRYTRPSSTKNGSGTRFTRLGNVEEDLPNAPADAWPVPVYSSNGDVVSAVPWSPLAAFHDPRVRGPTTYLHGIDEASWQNEGSEEKRRENQAAAPKNENDFRLDIEPHDRFHADTLMMTEVVLEDFTRAWGMTQEEVAEILESTQPTEAYLATLATPVEKLPHASSQPRSPLFSVCWMCLTNEDPAYQAVDEDRSGPYDGKCPKCRAPLLLPALPEPVRLLLLHIIKPPTGDNGQPIIVTAQEAYDAFNGVLESDGAKMTKVYEDWAAHQAKVVRPERPNDLSLATIMKDEGYHRLLFFEHLRGRFLDDEPLLPETRLYTMKYLIRDQLTPTQRRKVEELRAICGSLESVPQASAASSSGKRAAESDDEQEAESEKKTKVAEEQEDKAEEAAEEASEDMNDDHADEYCDE